MVASTGVRPLRSRNTVPTALLVAAMLMHPNLADSGSRVAFSAAGFCSPRWDRRSSLRGRCKVDSHHHCNRGCAIHFHRLEHVSCWTSTGAVCMIDGSESDACAHRGDVAGVNGARLWELEEWLDGMQVDRGRVYGADDPPSVRLKRFPGQRIGLECTRELGQDSTVSACYASLSPWFYMSSRTKYCARRRAKTMS